MEAPMKRGHFIGIDCHCQFCEIAVVDVRGAVAQRHRCDEVARAKLKIFSALLGKLRGRQILPLPAQWRDGELAPRLSAGRGTVTR